MANWRSYKFMSEMKPREELATTATQCSNFSELTMAIDRMAMDESIRTDTKIYINRLLTKKWFYEGCPGCNKAAEKGLSCQHCNKYVEQTVPHFVMPVELSDAFGSVYSTAYDEQAKRIFWEEEGVIHKLLQLDPMQLRDITEDYLYQEFRVRVYTKKDGEGRVRHHIGNSW